VNQIRPWEVWWVDFSPRVGHEQAGDRPAIVVGTPLACAIPNGLALVVPVTNTDRRLVWQPAVVIGDRPSYAMCDQIRAISLQRLRRRHDVRLTVAEVHAIRYALRQLIDVA
jgi:mRNA interferase MazF